MRNALLTAHHLRPLRRQLQVFGQVTDEDFERAICGNKKATQNPTQHVHAQGRSGSHALSGAHKKPPVLPVPALPCENLQTEGMTPTGLEPVLPA